MVACNSTIVQFEPGAMILTTGSISNHLYILKSGQVRVGQDESCSYFGEYALYSACSSPKCREAWSRLCHVNCLAITRVEVITISPAVLKSLISHPAIVGTLFSQAAEQLSQLRHCSDNPHNPLKIHRSASGTWSAKVGTFGPRLWAPASRSAGRDLSILERCVFLRGTRLFGYLESNEATMLAQSMREVSYTRGEAIATRGEAGGCLAIMVSGVATSPEIGHFETGDSFGQIELLSGLPWTQNAVAQDEVVVLLLRHHDLLELCYMEDTTIVSAILLSVHTQVNKSKRELIPRQQSWAEMTSCINSRLHRRRSKGWSKISKASNQTVVYASQEDD